MIAGNDLICAVRGPIILITVGTLFALDHFTRYGFLQTWPVLLIVVGLLSLARRSDSRWRRYAPPGPGAAPNPAPPDAGARPGGVA